MTREEAIQIIQMGNGGWIAWEAGKGPWFYSDYETGEPVAAMDGDFSLAELKAMVWLMENREP